MHLRRCFARAILSRIRADSARAVILRRGMPTAAKYPLSYRCDAQRPSGWVKFRAGLCRGCWAGCCTLPVEASAADLVRLGVLDEMEAAQISRAVIRRMQSQGILNRYNSKTGIFVLAQKPNDDCVFLGEDRLCTVYHARPTVCRRFPEIGPRPGHCPAGPKAVVGSRR